MYTVTVGMTREGGENFREARKFQTVEAALSFIFDPGDAYPIFLHDPQGKALWIGWPVEHQERIDTLAALALMHGVTDPGEPARKKRAQERLRRILEDLE